MLMFLLDVILPCTESFCIASKCIDTVNFNKSMAWEMQDRYSISRKDPSIKRLFQTE